MELYFNVGILMPLTVLGKIPSSLLLLLLLLAGDVYEAGYNYISLQTMNYPNCRLQVMYSHLQSGTSYCSSLSSGDTEMRC